MLTIGLCFLVALMEGLDLQAAGIAAGGIAQAFALDKMQMGWIFSAGILGLLPGAMVGGMLADRFHPLRTSLAAQVLYLVTMLAGWFSVTGDTSFGVLLVIHGIISGCFFTLSASRSIARGMGRISNFNVALGLAFFAFVLISGDTAFILDNSVMAIGTNIREFLRMSFNSDAVAHTGFVQTWTIFYWAWYVAICYMCALWIARTSYGRTFREIAVANCIWAPLACWLTFCILGNYGMGQELFHGLKVSDAVGEIGTNGAALMVIQTLPLPKLAVPTFGKNHTFAA